MTPCVFEPSFGVLGITYDVHLGLIGKRVVDFLLVLIELYSLGVTAEAIQAKIDTNKMLSYRRETALQGALLFSPKVEDSNWETIFYRHYMSIFNHCDVIGQQSNRIQ